MNILFVNYGDFTTNSLNHIGGFANALCAAGHACVVAVPQGKNTTAHLRAPLFIPATFAEVLAKPALFPDGRPADIVHAWTPREGVRKFVVAYQRATGAAARVLVHLEDNERFLLESFTGKSFAALREQSPAETGEWLIDALPHPLRHESFLRVADGVTHIVDRLKEFVPAGTPTQLLFPGVDAALYHPQPADAVLRRELGLRDGERAIVFTGSTTFANEPEMRELYLAVALLNQRGTPTRLVRTGFNRPEFLASLAFDYQAFVLDLGFVEKAKLPRLLALADVLVQPGRAGAFNDYRLPSKLPEFLAMGQPVVLPATNLARLLRDGRDALFLQTGAPDEIADACQRVFADAKLRATLGKNAVAFAHEHFDLAKNTRTLAAFYAATRERPARIDWSLAADPFASEATLIAAHAAAQARASDQVESDLSLVAALVRHLEQTVAAGVDQTLVKERDELRRVLELTEQHVRNLEPQLKLTHDHAANLEQEAKLTRDHVANLERALGTVQPRFERSEVLRQQAETLLRAARQQLLAYELEIERMEAQTKEREVEARRQLDHAEQNFRESDREARHYRALAERSYEENRRLAEQMNARARAARAELQARDAELAQRAAKLQRMQESFSWRATGWLRFLRRKLVDPFLRPAAPAPAPATAALDLPTVEATRLVAPTFRVTVDAPNAWSFAPKTIVVRGWCVPSERIELKHLRATINGTRRYHGAYGLKRLDVLAEMREIPWAEFSGWRIELPLQENDHELVLEVGDAEEGWHTFFTTPLHVGHEAAAAELTSYDRWAQTFDRHTTESLAARRRDQEKWSRRPLISIVMPVYNTPEKWLRKAIDSVQAQIYPHWELCIADDASTKSHLRTVLEGYAAADPRIKVTYRAQNGHISAASNSALELATGEFVALLDHDDELAPHALHEVVALLNLQPETDVIYTDEDKIDEEGRRHDPHFKPDWQPELFHGQNYLSHLTVHRTALVRAAGGFRVGYEGSQDWDLALRVIDLVEKPERIRHIPKVLYHWRAIAGSTALRLSEKNYPVEAARRALTDHFARRREPVTLHPVPGDHWRVQHHLPAHPPLVSLVIPTRNGLKFLQRCVDSLLEQTTYPAFEVIVVDNGSDDPETLAYLQSLAQGTHPQLASAAGKGGAAVNGSTPPERSARVLRYDAPFNYSAINNYAVQRARGEIVGLLNNDLEVITPGWLEEMVTQALRPGVGCVGAMLYYPNDTIQHAGVIVGLGGVAGHAFRDYPRGTDGKFNRARLVQSYSAVTAACLVVRRAIFEQVGGLDATKLTVAFNDIDFCLKVQAAGYRNVWTPFAEFYHYESASRGGEDTPEKHERFRGEVEVMTKRWSAQIRHDPAYNPNLTLEHADFSLAAPPRPWHP